MLASMRALKSRSAWSRKFRAFSSAHFLAARTDVQGQPARRQFPTHILVTPRARAIFASVTIPGGKLTPVSF